MPEIAEVRTVKRALDSKILGLKIVDIIYRYDNIIKSNKDEFKKVLIGKTFNKISTNGKWLIFDLGEYGFVSHLRMEGKYNYIKSDIPYDKHEHIIFKLDNGYDLRYKDVRKFGIMSLVKTKDASLYSEIAKLGIEPDSDKLTKEYIYNHIQSNKHIKELLLDQSIINGLGNIYVDEVLFASKIDPRRLGKDVTIEECDLIRKACFDIISKATIYKGTTIRSYTSELGVIGEYQNYLKVHTKVGKPCEVCGSTIIKIRVGGRGTYLCPKCQK